MWAGCSGVPSPRSSATLMAAQTPVGGEAGGHSRCEGHGQRRPTQPAGASRLLGAASAARRFSPPVAAHGRVQTSLATALAPMRAPTTPPRPAQQPKQPARVAMRPRTRHKRPGQPNSSLRAHCGTESRHPPVAMRSSTNDLATEDSAVRALDWLATGPPSVRDMSSCSGWWGAPGGARGSGCRLRGGATGWWGGWDGRTAHAARPRAVPRACRPRALLARGQVLRSACQHAPGWACAGWSAGRRRTCLAAARSTFH